MIEFKGTYHLFSKADPVAVLVQYDGVILHVWHTSEPFHRLALSDEFHVARPLASEGQHTIKLPNGSRIRTYDPRALELLPESPKLKTVLTAHLLPLSWLLLLIGSTSIGMMLWCLSGF
jgi:hypothetical protein